ncbi:MAG: hypothetical protein L6265_05560 [Thermoplasmatales archaeon]|nr:hypothetical protein [Thermoplasmatales archaeon]
MYNNEKNIIKHGAGLTKIVTPDGPISFNYCSCPTLTGIDSTYGDCGACGPSSKRISKTVDGKTMYSICFDPTMDLDENGNVIARYVQNPNMLDEPISIETAGGKYYYLFDGLGSVTGLTDGSGNLVSTYKYDAFGNIISETGDATLNAINPYRFTSRVYDKESGLYYYRARYYDPNTGRFTQKDPLRSELREGKNLYVYVGNNPVVMVDPTGCWGWSWTWRSWKYYLCKGIATIVIAKIFSPPYWGLALCAALGISGIGFVICVVLVCLALAIGIYYSTHYLCIRAGFK